MNLKQPHLPLPVWTRGLAARGRWVRCRLPWPPCMTLCRAPSCGVGTAPPPAPASSEWGPSSWSTQPRSAPTALWKWRCQDSKCCTCSSILPCSSIRRAASWTPCRGRSLLLALISPGNVQPAQLICILMSTSPSSPSVAHGIVRSQENSIYISPFQC